MPALNSTTRFSTRVENYIKYRPHYPAAIIGLLEKECGLNRAATVADIGSGTGILTELFLRHGSTVIGIEPNTEMRAAAERLLSHYPTFRSLAATAEATTLPNQSVEIITAGQAFHWFDLDQARTEFRRILRSTGWIALIWNDRNISAHPFFAAYEELLRTYGTDYEAVGHKHVDDKIIGRFFQTNPFQTASFPNEQNFDFDGLKGRLLSSSYAPEPGQPKHGPMLQALAAIFEKSQENGTVRFRYDTVVYYGQLLN